MKAEFAKSLSGHDKNRIYLIVKEEDRFSYLADGDAHTIAKLKKKNRKHYQVIKNVPNDILERLAESESWTDENIRRAVRQYERLIKEVGGRENVKSRCH